MIFRRVALGLAALISFAIAPAAQAVPTLQMQLFSGSATSGVLIDASNTGELNYSGPLGVFTSNRSTSYGLGSISTFLGSTLHLNSVQTSALGGEIIIEATETNISGPVGLQSFQTRFGGIVGGQNSVLRLEFYVDSSNLAFGKTALISSMLRTEGGSSFSATAAALITGNYSQTIRATLTAAPGSISSFDAEIYQVPLPGTIALLGLGLLALGVRSSGRKQA